MTNHAKNLVSLVAASALVLVTGCSTFKKKEPVSFALFNGKDLSGWKAVSEDPNATMEQVWSVRDGMIVCTGTPMGYLHSDIKFINYRLELEYRWAPDKDASKSNSGVFGRINGEPRKLPRCIETQLKNGSAGDLYGFHGMMIGGEESRSMFKAGHEIGGDLRGVKRMVGNEKPAGEWNKVEILCKGGNVTVWLNELQVNEAKKAEVVPGYVGLQSEGGEVHFRNIRIASLD